VTQLHDAETAVVTAAVAVLEEACSSSQQALQVLAASRPRLVQLRADGRWVPAGRGRASGLLLLLLTLPVGFSFLVDAGWTSYELRRWRVGAAGEMPAFVAYAASLEDRLDRALTGTTESLGIDAMSAAEDTTMLPHNLPPYSSGVPDAAATSWHIPYAFLRPHLYAVLGRTAAGSELLIASGALEELVEAFGDPAAPNPAGSLLQRAAVWALAHIASSPVGYDLVSAVSVPLVPTLVRWAETCKQPLLRTTAFLALPLAVMSPAGLAALRDLDWLPAFSPTSGTPRLIALPRDLSKLFLPAAAHVPFTSSAGPAATQAASTRAALTNEAISRRSTAAKVAALQAALFPSTDFAYLPPTLAFPPTSSKRHISDRVLPHLGRAGRLATLGGGTPQRPLYLLSPAERVAAGHVARVGNVVLQDSAVRALRETHERADALLGPHFLVYTLSLLSRYPAFAAPARRFSYELSGEGARGAQPHSSMAICAALDWAAENYCSADRAPFMPSQSDLQALSREDTDLSLILSRF
jgi:hypothetical protein